MRRRTHKLRIGNPIVRCPARLIDATAGREHSRGSKSLEGIELQRRPISRAPQQIPAFAQLADVFDSRETDSGHAFHLHEDVVEDVALGLPQALSAEAKQKVV